MEVERFAHIYSHSRSTICRRHAEIIVTVTPLPFHAEQMRRHGAIRHAISRHHADEEYVELEQRRMRAREKQVACGHRE